MKRAFALTSLFVLLVGSVSAGEPATRESNAIVITPKPGSGNSLPVLAEANRPPAEVPASRAARAEWQKRLAAQRRGASDAPPNGGKTTRRGNAAKRRESGRRGDSRNTKRRPSNRRKNANDEKSRSTKKKPDSKSAKKRPPKKSDSRKKPSAKNPNASNQRKPDDGGKADGQGVSDDAVISKAESDLPVIVPRAVRMPSYASVRATIPFSRSEWEADPTYRHNGTMELMLGQLRDMVVYRYPPMGAPGMPGSGVTINNGGGYPGYPGFYGGFPFGFTPGMNGAIQSRAILNPFQTPGFIGRAAPTLP